ncbi:CBS domain-containing protein [Clostridium fermenticellae]|uniref:CBS domain-containing protein n=1 Tax=Clostridium fermenticellae TaxID=2068654 RepID=A0A386H6U6_9CLOT|nr:CBS domain-containing protein [Clostridium fermenticellae]AYD41245.1 CBS domain-containing protein [Clostridium fermenticellae]
MKVNDIMSKEVISLNANDTVEKAAHIMKNNNIGSVPVCDSGRIVGVITDRDISIRSVAYGRDMSEQKVRDIMSSNPAVGTPEMDVKEAAKIMSQRQIRRLPIIENRDLVGIVSLGDMALDPNLQNITEGTLGDISEPSTPEV